MSTIHRAGVTIAGLAASLTIAGAFVAQGYVAAQNSAPKPTDIAQTTAAQTASAPTDPAQQTETIYVNPVPSASVVHVVQTAPPAPLAPAVNPPVIHVVVAGGGEPGDGSGQGDD
ncbi:MAG TPA: hypothetical protein VF361_00180 [Candidatus Limnocylindrales bacterium]